MKEKTKEEAENDTMASNGIFLTQPERVPENMSALSVESLFLTENQSQSNNLHSQEAEIVNPEENSTPKENITTNSIDPNYQANNLMKPFEEGKSKTLLAGKLTQKYSIAFRIGYPLIKESNSRFPLVKKNINTIT
jgi:hypothetical protein